jgi:hypothetical protein
MQDMTIFHQLRNASQFFTVQFSGQAELDALEGYLKRSEYVEDYRIGCLLAQVREIVNKDHALMVSFGREYSTVLYIRLIKNYFYGDIGLVLLHEIEGLNFRADESRLSGDTLRLWWD